MKPVACRIDVACNDSENGNFDGRAAALQVGDILELTSHDMKGPVFRVEADAIVLSGKRFPIIGSKDWFGNWVWNAYWLALPDAIALLTFVHRRGKFSVDMGVDPMFDLWKKQGEWNDADLRQLTQALAEEFCNA